MRRHSDDHADPGFPVHLSKQESREVASAPDIQVQTGRPVSIPQATLAPANDEDHYEGPVSFFLDQLLLGSFRNVVVPENPGDAWFDRWIEHGCV